MAGARKFKQSAIARTDLMSANREMERETGIPFVTEAQNDKAVAILKS